MVLIVGSVVSQRTNPVSQFLVRCSHGSAVAECTEVLTRIETESGGVSKGADPAVFIYCPMSLSTILNDFESVPPCYLHDGIHITGLPVEMYGHDGFSLIRYRLLYKGGIDVVGTYVRFDKHRAGSHIRDGQYSRNICV